MTVVTTHQVSDFKAKMHQIRFRLGLSPRPRWGSLQRSPRPLAGFKGTSRNQIWCILALKSDTGENSHKI